jgi:hypothetical protein
MVQSLSHSCLADATKRGAVSVLSTVLTRAWRGTCKGTGGQHESSSDAGIPVSVMSADAATLMRVACSHRA